MQLSPVIGKPGSQVFVVPRLAADPVYVLGQHHRHAACSHEVPDTVHAGAFKSHAALSGVRYLLEDLVSLAGGVLPQSLDLLGEGVPAPCLLVGRDAGVEDGPLGAVGGGHYLHLIGHYLVHPCFRIVRLAYIPRLLPTSFSKMEVPIRTSLRKPAVLLARVGTLLKLKDSVLVVATLHHSAHWSITDLLPPAVYGLL